MVAGACNAAAVRCHRKAVLPIWGSRCRPIQLAFMSKKYPAKQLGDLPHAIINRTLGTALEPGRVYLSTQAHRHIATDHAGDYRLVMDTIEVAIREPTYLGQGRGKRPISS